MPYSERIIVRQPYTPLIMPTAYTARASAGVPAVRSAACTA